MAGDRHLSVKFNVYMSVSKFHWIKWELHLKGYVPDCMGSQKNFAEQQEKLHYDIQQVAWKTNNGIIMLACAFWCALRRKVLILGNYQCLWKSYSRKNTLKAHYL